jgi:YD repeat-containing protein
MNSARALQTLRRIAATIPGKVITLALVLGLLVPQPLLVFAEEAQTETESPAKGPVSADAGGSGGQVSLLSSGGSATFNPYNEFGNSLRLSRINELSGAFTYSVPIAVPPGRNGMQPELALVYNSQKRDEQNIVGYGWDVPIPYVERQNKVGIEDLYSVDTFYSTLSGELATTTSPNAFLAKSDDGSFLKYDFSSSTNRWTVQAKDGHISKFGYATTSRMYNQSTTTEAFRWMLDEERDSNGNYVKYEYAKDGGFPYLSKITYTGNGSTDGIFTVDFIREQRADNATSSAPRFETETRYRTSEIDVSANGEWVRKYQLAYAPGDNGKRSLLQSVTESGRTEGASPTTSSLPPTTFAYEETVPGWATTTDFALPQPFLEGPPAEPWGDTGLRVADVNGDALPDLIYAPAGTSSKVYINNGSGWDDDPTWYFPVAFLRSGGGDAGVRLADLNGDGLIDILQKYNIETPCCSSASVQYLNTGAGWATTTNWTAPFGFLNIDTGRDIGTRLVDINGDGLADLVRVEANYSGNSLNNDVYLNNGSGFVFMSTTIRLPVATVASWNMGSFIDHETLGTRFADVNNDGLMDIVTRDNNQWQGQQGVFLNTGTGWTKKDTWTVPHIISSNRSYEGQHLADVNGDGLVDYIEGDENKVYINDGSNWVYDATWTLPIDLYNTTDTTDGYSTSIIDVDGDGMVDMVQRDQDAHQRYLNIGEPVDVLTRIDESTGAQVDITYQSSATLTDGGGSHVNAKLPLVVQVAKSVAKNDGIGTIATTTYQYKDGLYYFGNLFDRTFAGFGTTETTDPDGNVTKVYRHQGNETASTSGELSDHFSKIGRVYREEQYDSNSNLFKLTINKWSNVNRGPDAEFVSLSTTTTLLYDGNGDHKDTAESYAYSTTTGDVLAKVEWGEVTGSTDGAVTDTGSDKRTTAISYAASSTGYLIAPSQETVTDQSGGKIRETRNYYDTLSLGSVNAGNLTKQEQWLSGSSYIDTEKTYNSYGLVTQEKDPRDKVTTYVYDAFNLYAATTTNPLSHVGQQLYDYSSGKVKELTDANGRIFQTIFDALDRVIEEKQPDLTTPSTLVTKDTYEYTDTGMPRRIKKTNYLTASTTAESYSYLNGFGRTVEERTEAEGSQYAIKDYVFNKRGLLQSESLPFFGSGTLYTGTTTPPASALLTRYTYDALGRTTAVANAVGTTTQAYDQWKVTTTDANGKTKDSTSDAYGNLVQVVEHNGGSNYTTAYEYNGNNLLTKETDALGNIRNFTYDGLGRRLSAQDLHAAADATFGAWTYVYDSASNVASSTDPRGQVIEYTYDDLNRALTENYTGAGGTEVSYAYDSCADGKGRLCVATSTGAVSKYAYNALGGVASETKTINSTNYATSYTYDRQGNTTGIVYPDASEVGYAYNTAGQLESVQYKPSGGSFSDVVRDFDYAPTGAVAYKELGNDTATTYTFDPNELYRLKRIQTVLIGGIGGMGDASDSPDSLEALLEEGALTGMEATPPEEAPVAEDDSAPEGEVAGVSDVASPEAPLNDEDATTSEIVIDGDDEAATTSDQSLLDIVVGTTTDDILIVTDTQTSTPETAGDDLGAHIATTTDDVATKVEIAKGGSLIKSSDDAKAWRAFHAERVAYLQSQKNLPERVLQSAQYAQQDFEQKLIDKGFIKEPQGEISTPISLLISNFFKSMLAFILPEKAYAYVFGVEDFESCGSLPCSFSSNESWGSVTPSLDHTSKVAGEDSLKEVVSGEGGGGMKKGALNSGEVWAQFKVWVPSTVTWGGSGYFSVMTMQDSGSNDKVWMNVEDYGTPRLTLGGSSLGYIDTGLNLTPNAVNTIEVRVKKGTTNGDVDIWLNNTTQGSPNYNGSGTMNVGSANIDGILFGTTYAPESGVSTLYYDNAIIDSAFIGAGASNSAPTAPTSLLAEGQTNPTNVSDPTPELSAVYNDPDTSDVAASYQIQVSTSSAFASTKWDSGKTALASSTPQGTRIADISYGGTSLASSTTYYWRIKFWDTADAQGAWSTATSTFVLATTSSNSAPTAPTSLQTEGQTNPTDISDPTPEFTAIYNDPDTGDSANKYRIQVATSSAFTSVFWDSGTTTMATTTQASTSPAISYAGTALASSTTYYWRIKFFDLAGAEGAWSTATSTFSLATSTASTTPFSGVLQDISYTYDAVGNITQIVDHSDTGAGKTVLYGYDDLYRLTSASTTAASSTPYRYQYAYDALGSITATKLNAGATTTYSYAGTNYANPHAATSIGGATHAYDNAGNLTSDGTWQHTWDYRNRLTASHSTATTTYAYDHTTNRVSCASACNFDPH